MAKKKSVPGRKWRFTSARPPVPGTTLYAPGIDINSDGHYQFDELVVDDWLHIEQMDTRDYWMRVGGNVINIHINPDGTTKVHIEAY